MAGRERQNQHAITGESGWLTLKEAARLCGTTTANLRNQIERGKLRAYTVQHGGKVRFRLLHSSLVDAGLLGHAVSVLEPDRGLAVTDLLSLVREQNQRISALEDQRAILSGQLGMALERLRSIDERLHDLEILPEVASTTADDSGSGRVAEDKRGIGQAMYKVVAGSFVSRRWKRRAT